MARKLKGKQIATGTKGLRTANLNDGILSADAAGRAKIAPNFFDTATLVGKVQDGAITLAVASAKIADAAIPLSKLAENPIQVFAITDKSKFVASPTSGNNANTGLTVVGTPVSGTFVSVYVAGLMRRVANGPGEQAIADCYFSSGGTVRAYGAVVTGDTLFWNGVVAGFNLLTTTRVDFLYLV